MVNQWDMAWNWTNLTGFKQAFIGGATGALLATMIFLFIIFCIVVYVYAALALMAIAKKTKTKNAWLAWIPIANFYLLTQMAKKSGHWTWILLLSVLPFGRVFVLAAGIWFFWIVAKKLKFPGWISLLLAIPLVNLVVLGIMAWKKK